jgi:hypothetical protein
MHKPRKLSPSLGDLLLDALAANVERPTEVIKVQKREHGKSGYRADY